MTKEDKKLLFEDLSARLLYHPKAEITFGNTKKVKTLESRDLYSPPYSSYKKKKYEVKLYLRSMTSMTEEEKTEISKLLNYEFYVDSDCALVAEDDRHRIRLDLMQKYIDWLNAHHFDYRGLIEKGLAFEAPEGMYKVESANI